MFLSAPIDQRSTINANLAGTSYADCSGQSALFNCENLLGCGYVGNREVVHISTVWACGPCG